MSAKNRSKFGELRHENGSRADRVLSGKHDCFPELVEFQATTPAGNSVSGAELRELIRSLGGMRVVQDLLRQRRGIHPNAVPIDGNTARLRELVKLLGKQHAAEHHGDGGLN